METKTHTPNFTVSLRGYDREEVDEYLDSLRTRSTTSTTPSSKIGGSRPTSTNSTPVSRSSNTA